MGARKTVGLLAGRKLGILVAAPPGEANFSHALGLAHAALEEQVDLYLYFIDEGVLGLALPEAQGLKARGAKLFGCAYSLQKRNLSLDQSATFVGLTMLNEIIAKTDRFLSFT